MSRTLPWVSWYDRDSNLQDLIAWEGDIREVVLVGVDTPDGPLPDSAIIYEISEGVKAQDVAKATGGIVVIVFDVKERFGPLWQG